MTQQAFTAAYLRSRFFHGERAIDSQAMETNGISNLERSTYPGASDPSYTAYPGQRGPIYLATAYGEMVPYAGTGMAVRVFLNHARAATMHNNANQYLSEQQFRNYAHAAAAVTFHRLYKDRDNPNAVVTGADIPADCVWGGTLAGLAALGGGNARVQTIMANIRSFDGGLPADTAALVALMRGCVAQGTIGDVMANDLTKNTIDFGEPAPVVVPVVPQARRGEPTRSGCCTVM